jgi:DNA-binding transcriptional regulator YhcF (GntR family)
MKYITIDSKSIIPIYEQLKNNLLEAMENGTLKLGDRIPSINKICGELSISPGTVIKAYDDLCAMGILGSRKGKGYFISGTNTKLELNIFLLLDRLNSYKEILYNSFNESIGLKAKVDVYFHHYDLKRFEHLISENLGNYNYYVIMPHFNTDVSEIVKKIPIDKLVVIDKTLDNIQGEYISVCQNFHEDIINSLTTGVELFRKYKTVNFIASAKNKFQFIPDGCVTGFKAFCVNNSINYKIIDSLTPKMINENDAYLVFAEGDLIMLLKEAKIRNLKLGKNLGIITYDDTPVKEVLANGITTISTDFYKMGKFAAECILNNKKEKVFNPFHLIKRNSL